MKQCEFCGQDLDTRFGRAFCHATHDAKGNDRFAEPPPSEEVVKKVLDLAIGYGQYKMPENTIVDKIDITVLMEKELIDYIINNWSK